MTLDLPSLAALARAATPGPWAYRMGDIVQLTDGGKGYPLDYYPDSEDVVARDRDGDTILADRNAEFIAACSPSTVLELVARLRSLEAVIREIETALVEACELYEQSQIEMSDRLDQRFAALRALVKP